MDRGELPATTSLVLLDRIRAGDAAALNELIRRYLPRLSRWAAGRLPTWARDLSETDDLVQETLARAATQLGHFEHRHDGALQAYLRRAVMNRIRDEIRRRQRTPDLATIDEAVPSTEQSPLERAIGTDVLAQYDRALEQLDEESREAVIARIEMGCSYVEIADALGKSSPDAARMSVSRALVKLAEVMRHVR